MVGLKVPRLRTDNRPLRARHPGSAPPSAENPDEFPTKLGSFCCSAARLNMSLKASLVYVQPSLQLYFTGMLSILYTYCMLVNHTYGFMRMVCDCA